MKLRLLRTLVALRARLRRRRGPVERESLYTEPPLRAELFSAERMERHGKTLARAHRVGEVRPNDLLLHRLSDNEDVINQACARLSDAAQQERALTPAGEWLLDNIYMIEEQVRIARRHLPKGYSRELPRLASGPSMGLPRVYDLALNAIAHSDGRVDEDSLSRFIIAYQTVAPLRLGELWAIPIMLRLALIENLRRVCARVIIDLRDRDLAEEWADRLTDIVERDPKSLVLTIADMARSQPPASRSFVAELTRRLQGQSAALALPLTWVEQWLAEGKQNIERMVQAENQQQAADQVSIGNSIGSLRFLTMMDWRDFVEDTSTIEQILRRDPHGTYASMDFATRDRYRHAIEDLARRAKMAEPDVAARVLVMAEAHAESAGADAIASHVGYYLIDQGRHRLVSMLPLRYSLAASMRRTARMAPLLTYAAPMAAIVALFTQVLVEDAESALDARGLVWLVAVLCVIAFSELAVALVNWAATLLLTPRALPRLDFTDGIPANARALVVVPTMFATPEQAEQLAEALEVRFLANRDRHLQFALLSDFMDADTQTLPGDAEALKAAQAEIDRLNTRYANEEHDVFFLLHRPRVWNPRERRWMGYERKRGKLAALNALLRGHGRDAFLRIAGDPMTLGTDIRYVITLDTDTRLPRDAARELIGTLAHPLNQAQFDADKNIVVRGYGILQPQVGTSMSAQRRTWYARIFSSEPGIDPYTRTVSNVYQDLFGEGSFVGKGIYDVDAFERAMDARFPENRILSHDLLEGCYARAGVVSDVQLYEEYPGSYAADVKRRHRWIRGDWQLLPWLFPRMPTMDDARERNPLSLLSRAKLLDNLRRSLVSAAVVTLLVLGWLLATHPLRWTMWLLAIPLAPPFVASLMNFVRKPQDMPLETHLHEAALGTLRSFAPVPMAIASLPFEAFYSLDAIVRTLWRTLASRRYLLQWTPSSEVERSIGNGMVALLYLMWFSPLFAILVSYALWRLQPQAWPVATPILALWLLAPVLMWWLGRARARRRAELSISQLDYLGKLSRRIWAFFETYVTADEHWLPPDNVQEHPAHMVAHRTSPTNIGLALLANLSAFDFGYTPIGIVMTRTANTLRTLESLPRFRGHFYNWYDTQTLVPMAPKYVSTVDSGNLAGHLLTLRQGLLALCETPLMSECVYAGLGDTLGVLHESLEAEAATHQPDALVQFAHALAAARMQASPTLAEATTTMGSLGDMAQGILDALPQAAESILWSETLLQQCRAWHEELQPFVQTKSTAPASMTLRDLCVDESAPMFMRDAARARILELERLAHVAGQCAQMDYRFLYDRTRNLLSIGYNVDERRLDTGYYDLLASEARLCNFVAIAQNQLPQESWFALGRLLTDVDGDPTLLSWSGSMFEYLMPQLVMPSYEGTLLQQSARTSVERQIEYGRQRDVPWGISESGYNTVDARMNYQYRAFGVPGLGLKRGLAQDLVIAPYASMMALMVAPEAACQNLQRMTAEGVAGRFGHYEAIDYTPARVPRGQQRALVRSFMAHHQGMGLLSLLYLLRDQPMQRRFGTDPEFQATMLLLQERIPRTGVFHPHAGEVAAAATASHATETRLRIFRDADSPRPAVQMLSNGRYHVMLSNAGGGYNRLREMSVTRWREDATRDHWGSFCYLRDIGSGAFWSTSYQPTCVPVDGYEAIFSDAKAEFRGRSHGFETHVEIAVSPEDDIELRRLHITNRTRATRTIEITTYAEVVLAPAIADELHPAFNNLFVQSELVPDKQAILCTRRPRSQEESPEWMLHLLAVHDADIDSISYETDRARFIGRGNTPRTPDALRHDVLSNTQGSVLDAIVAIRCRITLAPEQTASIDMVTGVGGSRGACNTLIDKYRDRRLADRVFDLAWTHNQVVRRQINASQADAQLYERLAGLVIYAHHALRAESSVLLQNRRGQSGLWAQAISGDHPVVLVQIHDVENLDLVRQMVQAHVYWRLKGLIVDLVIWNEDQAGYRQQLQDQIMGLVAVGLEANAIDRPGGIFVRMGQQIPHEDRILVQSVARIIISDLRGELAEQVTRRQPADIVMPLLQPAPTQHEMLALPKLGAHDPHAIDVDQWPFDHAPPGRMLDNGIGAFSSDGREYLIRLRAGQHTPAPWANVLANPEFGCVVSDSSLGYTWAENAHEFRLTPWHNDPVSDSAGEAFYLRDEDTGHVWSPTALPSRGEGDYLTRHGFGYSVYEHVEDGIASELWVYVALDQPVKFTVLKLRNIGARTRRISATGYVEWILGDLHARTQMHVITELDAESGAISARNPYSTEFNGRAAFFHADTPASSGRITHTGDRAEFLGRNGNLHAPAAMARERLSGRLAAGLDPCAAIQVPVSLAPGEETEVIFRLGSGTDLQQTLALARRMRGSTAAYDALDEVRIHWVRTLGAVQVQTPEPELDFIANGWLMYQTIACRYFARSGYYQSGGAFGFRDQLQDVMAMVHAEPHRLRAHLLLSAAHQFPEGDVQHWWHPPQDRGVRTRCSDDYLWLPLAVSRYIEVIGDTHVLDEQVEYIEGRAVNPGEESYYDLPTRSGLRQTLYQHCLRALQRGMDLIGERGLPLIATGDWNDGMNRVGEQGRGESVWLGFFLHDVLNRFSTVARGRGDAGFADTCVTFAETLRQNLEAHAWDGEWYRRAWYDDGTPLGSTESDACKIDSIAQSWSVLSSAGDPQRARQAMESLSARLVHRDAGLVQLLDPPFNPQARTEAGIYAHDPGYIAGYVPGVRENGGQYTHAAIWATMAFAQLGDRDRAWELMRMINPLRHGNSAAAIDIYKVEPYVVAADVYAVAPHIGRGGWTWYTGSAGWMYRLIVESLLGVQRRGDQLWIAPCIPAHWPGYKAQYRHGDALYRINITQSDSHRGAPSIAMDGVVVQTPWISLRSAGGDHQVEVVIATAKASTDRAPIP